MAYYRRSAWTTLPNRAVAIKGRQRHVTAHYPGFSTNAQRVNNYSLQQCFALVRGWDSMHRRSGYTAIAYNFFITPHGHIIEGRGFRQNGANGTGAANRGGLSMQFIVGNTEPLTAGHVRGACELLAMIAREGHATGTIYGHRHWVSTACPGSAVMAAIRAGRFRPAGAPSTGTDRTPAVKPDSARPWLSSPRVRGYSEAEVRAIQQTLTDLGHDLGSYGVDGSYGDATGTAVKALQQQLGVTSDGIYGPGTEKALMTTLDKISKDLAAIKRTLEPGISGKRTDGEHVSQMRKFRNDIQSDIAALPARILDEPVDLEGHWKGQKSTLRRMRAWYAEDLRQIKAGIATSRAAVLEAVQETGKAQGLTDEQVQAIATAAAEASARVSAEDVAGQLEVAVRNED